MTPVTRSACAAALAVCALVLAAPAQAAKPTFSVKAPAAGDVTLAHVVFETKGGKGTPKLVLTNKAKLGSRLTVAGGVVKLKKNRYLASVALLLKTGGGGGTPAFKLAPPKGMAFSKFTAKQIAKNLLSTQSTPKFCGAVPRSFSYVSKKLLAGSAIPRFSATAELVRAGYLLDCEGYGDEEANLRAALRGEPDPNSAPPGSGGSGGTEEEEEEGEYRAPTSSTLQGSGTVFAEGNDVYRYEISFNEPVYGFLIQGAGNVRCPAQSYADWKAECDALGNSQAASGGGQSFPCTPGDMVDRFECQTPAGSRTDRSRPPQRTTVPAGTVIVGRFSTRPGTAPKPGGVKLTGYGPNGQSQSPATLSGP